MSETYRELKDDRQSRARQTSGRRSYGRLFVGIATMVLIVTAVLGGLVLHGRRDDLAKERAATRNDQVPAVRVDVVRQAPATFPVELPGTVAPISTASVNARATGYISKRMVDIGARVHIGEKLAIIESRELDSQVSQAQEALKQAKANYDLAVVTAQRSNELVDKGYVTRQRFDNDRLTESARAADLRGAKASLATIEQRRAYLVVISPFEGIVTQRNVDVGDLADADSSTARPLFVIARTDRVRVQVQVPQDRAGSLEVNDPVSVMNPEQSGHSIEGKVTRTAEALTEGSRTLLAEAEIPNPGDELVPGSYVRVIVKVRRAAAPKMISADTLIYDADGLSVNVVKDGTVEKRRVVIGRDFGTEIEVKSGLAAGEQIILNPPSRVLNGDKVTVLSDRQS